MKIRDKANRPIISPNSGALIALTGKIGTGKSFVMREIEELGYITFNSDIEAKQIIANSQEIKIFLETQYSLTIKNGEIDFKSLGDIAFKTPDLLQKLIDHTHSEIRLKQTQIIKNNPGKTIIFEIPLLFENKREGYFDYVLLTHSTPDIITKRVMQRKGMTESKLHGILAKQMNISPTDSRVDYCIDTSISDDHTKKQLLQIFDDS